MELKQNLIVSSFDDAEIGESINFRQKTVPNFTARIIKSSLFFFSNICVGYGSIILVPWLIRSDRRHLLDDSKNDKCEEMVQGTDFLILAVITGATNVIGRSLGYLLWRHVRFLVLQSTVTIIIILSYGVILTKPGLIAGSLLLGVAKLCYSVQAVEVAVLHFDYDYYGISGFELGSGVELHLFVVLSCIYQPFVESIE